MVERRKDWRPRLAAYLGEVARLRFRPGEHDCALFAAGAVEAMTGTDLAAGWRRTYRTLEDGLALLAQEGHGDHVALAAAHLEEVAPIRAQVGDVAAVREGAALALGIVQGPSIYVLRPSGLGLVPLTDAERAFRV